MYNEKPIIYPSYLDEFRCVGAKDCWNSCCAKQLFFIDKDEYLSLRNNSSFDLEVRTEVKLSFIRNDRSIDDKSDYAFSSMDPISGNCWLLESDGGCKLFSVSGQNLQPKRCSDFPKVFTEDFSSRYLFMSPSCPEVVRILMQLPAEKSISINQKHSVEHFSTPQVLAVADALTARYQMVREFGFAVLNSFHIPLQKRLMFLLLFSEAASNYFDNNQVEDLKLLIQSFDELLSSEYKNFFEDVVFDVDKYILLMRQLLKFRHERQQLSGYYDEILADVWCAFHWDKHHIDDSISDLSRQAIIDGLTKDIAFAANGKFDDFMSALLINYWITQMFPAACNRGLRINIVQFVLYFLLQRTIFAGMAAMESQDFVKTFSIACSAFHREWIVDSPMLTAAAISISKSSFGELATVTSLLASPKK